MGGSVRGSAGEERQVGQKIDKYSIRHKALSPLNYHLGWVLNEFLRNMLFCTKKYWCLGYIHGILNF